MRRAESENISRDAPLNNMLMPTSVPTAQALLAHVDGTRRFRCLLLVRPIRPFPSSTRACGVVWHHRSSSDSLAGTTLRVVVIR
jgi:hypothetical protein